jgi:hypothetical protein
MAGKKLVFSSESARAAQDYASLHAMACGCSCSDLPTLISSTLTDTNCAPASPACKHHMTRWGNKEAQIPVATHVLVFRAAAGHHRLSHMATLAILL